MKSLHEISRLAPSLGAGFGSASADIIHIRIPAHPRGAYIRWEIELPLIQTCCSPPAEVGVISHLIYGNFAGKARYDLLSAVMVCLPGKRDVSGGNNLHKLLSSVLSEELDVKDKEQILRNDFNIEISRKLKEELNLMCNLSDIIVEKAVKRGIEKGKISLCVELVKDGVLSLAEAARRACVSEAELKKYF